jgi:hypothetical protein
LPESWNSRYPHETAKSHKFDHQTLMFFAKAAGVLVEFAEHGGDDKVTFSGHEVGQPSDIAKHKGQGFSEGSLCFHPSHLNQLVAPASCARMACFIPDYIPRARASPRW